MDFEKKLILNIKNNNLEEIKKIVQNIDDINDKILNLVISLGHTRILKFLVFKGINIKTNHKENLKLACKYGRFYMVVYLLDQNNICYKDVLYIAVKYGHLDIVLLLVSKGATLDIINKAFEISCIYGHIYIVKFLHSRGARIDIQLIKLALKNKHLEVVEFLQDNYNPFPRIPNIF